MHKQKYQLEEERRIKELEEARDFQMSLIPQSPPEHPDYDIALHMKTSTEVVETIMTFSLKKMAQCM